MPGVSVTATGGNYNGSAFFATVTVTGVGGPSGAALEVAKATLTYYTGTQTSGTGSSAAPSAAGTYTVLASFAGSTDYAAAASAPVTFTIAKAVPVVSLKDAGGTYSGSAFAGASSVAGLNGSSAGSIEGVSPTLTYYTGSQASGTGSSVAPSAAGTYTVVASFAGSTDYAAAKSASVTFAISRATLTVPGITVNSKVYDGTTAATFTAAGASLIGVVRGDAVTLVTIGATATFAAKDVGTNSVQIVGLSLSGAQAGNYTLASFSTTASITPRALTVTAAAASKTYGTADPTFSVTYAGFASGESATILNGNLAFTTNEPSALTAPTGAYTITPSGLAAKDYAIRYVNGQLTVNKVQSATAVTVSSKKSSNTLTVSLTVTVGPAGSSVGTPTGTVTVVNTTTNAVLAKGTLSNGTASFGNLSVPANDAVTVNYAGDANFSSSSAAALKSSVAQSSTVAVSENDLGAIQDAALLQFLAGTD